MYIFLILTLTCWLHFLAWPGTSLIHMGLVTTGLWVTISAPALLTLLRCSGYEPLLARPWLLFAIPSPVAPGSPVLPGLWCALAPERSRFLGVKLSSHGYFPKHAAVRTEISNKCACSQIPLRQKGGNQSCARADQYNWLLIHKHFLVYLLQLCSTGSAAHTEAYTVGNVPPMLSFLEQLHFPLCA